jgi:hypothetical protein
VWLGRFAAVVGLLAGCAGTGCTVADRCRPETARMPPVRSPAPAPFTLEEVRGAMRVGRKDRFLTWSPAMAPAFGVREVVVAEGDRYDFKGETHEAPGWITGDATIRIRPRPPMSAEDVMGVREWFDRDLTTIQRVECETPLGRRDCIVYRAEQRDPDHENVVVNSIYVKDMPGPPVLTTMRVCRRLIHLSAIVEHTPAPGAPAPGPGPS